MRAILSKSFIIIGAISMSVMASTYFIYTHNSFLDSKSLSSSLWYVAIFKTHIAFGIISILTGAFQFIKYTRNRWPYTHRMVGKIYVFTIFISSTCGLVSAQFATGGLITRIGFSTLAILWFYFTFLAFKYARSGNIPAHSVWMYRSYALTFSSLTLRIFLLVALFSTTPFLVVYQFASWGCWITNLFICERILRIARRKKVVVTH